MKALASAAVILASSCSLLFVACGGHSTLDDFGGSDGGGGGDSGGGGGGGDSGGGDGGLSSSCPASLPVEGTVCTGIPLACEYGTDPNIYCNTVATCTPQGWQVARGNQGPTCPSPGIEKGCPESFNKVPQNATCAPPGVECDYPQGRCACTLGFGGPIQIDAGTGHWSCESPGQGCPQPRPRVGSSCSLPSSASCNYGACVLPGGVSMECQDGVWIAPPTACPASAG